MTDRRNNDRRSQDRAIVILTTKVENIEEHMVTKEEFQPVARVVYGIVSLVGAAFIVGLATLLF